MTHYHYYYYFHRRTRLFLQSTCPRPHDMGREAGLTGDAVPSTTLLCWLSCHWMTGVLVMTSALVWGFNNEENYVLSIRQHWCTIRTQVSFAVLNFKGKVPTSMLLTKWDVCLPAIYRHGCWTRRKKDSLGKHRQRSLAPAAVASDPIEDLSLAPTSPQVKSLQATVQSKPNYTLQKQILHFCCFQILIDDCDFPNSPNLYLSQVYCKSRCLPKQSHRVWDECK